MSPGAEPQWLEYLARRAARGETAAHAPILGVGARTDRGARLSRITLLRLAATAVLMGGSLRLLFPEQARAGALDPCIREAARLSVAFFQECSRDSREAYANYAKAIETALEALRKTKDPAKRKRLLKIIDQATAGQDRAIRKIETCNFQYVRDFVGSQQNCRDQYPPGGGGGGGGGGVGGGGSGCAPGTHGCVDSRPPGVCCFGMDACCDCAGGTTCCIYGDCRCCG